MPKLYHQPENPNFLNNNQFRFVLKRAPHIVYFCQETGIPGLTMPTTTQISPFVDIPRPGQRIQFDDLTLTFKVDEDFGNYLEIFNWIVAMGFPDNFGQYEALVGPKGKQRPVIGQEGVFSDATLTILNSANNPNVEVVFQDLFPVSLSRLDFTDQTSGSEQIDCSVSFKYQRFRINKI